MEIKEHLTPEEALTLAKTYVELHNLAAKDYKKAFKMIGANMWQFDNCHPLKQKHQDYIVEQMSKNYRAKDISHIYGIATPLTVLDSYPQISGDARNWLRAEVHRIHVRYCNQWNKAVEDILNGTNSQSATA